MISFASPPPNSTGNSEPKCRLTLSKVSRSSSRVSRSMRRIASSSVVDRLFQVGRLRVEEALALAAARQFVQRRQVDRAQLVHRLRQARDLALQRRGPRRALGFRRQPRLVGARLAQLRVVLVVVDLRRLLLQPQLVDALAQRRERALDLQASPPPARAARRPPPRPRRARRPASSRRPCALRRPLPARSRTAGTGSTASSAVRRPTSSSARSICWSIMRTELSISAIFADTSRSPNTASCASRSACCVRTRCSGERRLGRDIARAHRFQLLLGAADLLRDARQRRAAPRRAARRRAPPPGSTTPISSRICARALAIALERLAELERLDLRGVLLLLPAAERVRAPARARPSRSASCASMRAAFGRPSRRRAARAPGSALPAPRFPPGARGCPASAGSGAWKLTVWRVNWSPSRLTSSAPAGSAARCAGAGNALDRVDAGEPVGERAGEPGVDDVHLVLQRTRSPARRRAGAPPCPDRTGSPSPAAGPARARCCRPAPAHAGARAAPTRPRFPSRGRCGSSARSAAAPRAGGAPATHAAARPPPPRPAPASGSRAGRRPPCARGSLRRCASAAAALAAASASASACSASSSACAAAISRSSCSDALVGRVHAGGIRLGERLQLGLQPLAPLRRATAGCLRGARRSAARAAAGSRPAAACCAPRSAAPAPRGRPSRPPAGAAFSAARLACASATRCFAPPERAAHMCSACVSCERCSRQEPSCTRRSVCWLSSRLRLSSTWRSSDSWRATSALAA